MLRSGHRLCKNTRPHTAWLARNGFLVFQPVVFFAGVKPVKTKLFRHASLGAGAFFLISACSSDDTSTPSTSASTSTTATGGAAGSGSGSTTDVGSGGSAGSGGAGSSMGGAGGGSGGATGGGGGNGGSGGGTGGSGGSADGGVACNTSPGKAIQVSGPGADFVSGDLGMDLPGGDVPRTIEVWAKYTGATSWIREQSIMETGLAPINVLNRVLELDTSGYTGTTAEFGPYTNGYSDNNHPDGVYVMNIPQIGWIHLSWSYAGSGKLSFTVNGMEYPIKTSGAPTINFFPGIVTLGRSQTFGANWTGVIDEVRIWSIARTPTEVARDMKVMLKGTETGLVAYYHLDEGTGIVTDDVSKKPSHRLTTCQSVVAGTRCNKVANQNPNLVTWVTSDIPGPFTCAP